MNFWYVVWFILGLLLGLGIYMYGLLKNKQSLSDKLKPYGIIVFWTLFWAYAGYMYFKNYSYFVDPAPVDGYDGLKKRFFENKTNVHFALSLGFLGLVTILSFTVKVIFSNWEQIKFLGFEAKRIVEKTRDAANEELEYRAKIEKTLLSFLGTVASEQVYQQLKTFYAHGHFDSKVALELIVQVLKGLYETSFSIHVKVGLVEEVGGDLDAAAMNELPFIIKREIKKAWLHQEKLLPRNADDRSTIVVKVKLNQAYYYIFMDAFNFTFDLRDHTLFDSTIEIMENHIRRMESEAVAHRGSSVV